MSAWWVEQLRGDVVEARHRVHACAVDDANNVLWQVGDDLVTTSRSAAKPFQLEVSYELLSPALRDVLTSADIALGSASHHGEPEHVAAVRQLMSKLSCDTEQLYCGAHDPLSLDSTRQLYARGELPEVVHNNCSGKHTFMACAAATCGYPADYRPLTHPLQQHILERIGERTGLAAVTTVVDGCGLPCFVLPLSSMARCYAQLASSTVQGDGSALCRVGEALLEHPLLMSGHQGFDGWLIRSSQLIAKVGAQGLLCIALPRQRLGIAIKIESGVDAARPVAATALLEHFMKGVLSEPLPARFFELRNVVGDLVGELVCRR